MRWFALVVLCVISSGVRAGAVFLIPTDNPKPTYPRALNRAGITGEVRVSLTVHADGSVSNVAVPKDAHPDLAEASQSAVSQWRFQPWEISGDRPAQIQVVAPMVFRLDDTPPIHANEELKKLRCSDVSRVAQHFSDFSWVDLPVFNWTRSYLTHSISPTQFPEEKRLALIAKLNKSAPSIVRSCNTHPTSRFVRFLPQDIRELL
ncbi:energy transducer TonB [Pseudomonas sp. 008]|uniref:energy transducer TonB n=1 Tax=Pseudomonas sp. 008 TaxID=2803906 RepID=UPI0019516A18|nr:energy transducer TonB [Pseudomonas sp. 008]